MVTVESICREIPQLNENGDFPVIKVKRGESVPSIVEGMRARRAPVDANQLYEFSPEELLSLIVPVLTVNGRVVGFQRPFDRRHARKIALALLAGEPVPEISVAIDGKGRLSVVEGQHRAVAGVMAGVPIAGVVRKRGAEEQRQLFAGQRKAKPVDRNVLILAGHSAYDRYIQRACEGDPSHPWDNIVSANTKSRTRITPTQMQGLLLTYVGETKHARINPVVEARWDRVLADELARLVSCFGDKHSNPIAFSSTWLRGIGEAALEVLRRNERAQEGDVERWITHMPKFPWETKLFVRRQSDATYWLIDHWNKRLHASRKVRP